MKKNTLGAITIIALIIGAFGLTFGYFAMTQPETINPIILLSQLPTPQEKAPEPQDTGMLTLESGTYTGTYLFGKTLLIPEGNVVNFTNAQIYGPELYVYGNLILKNSFIDHSIYGHNNSLIQITNSKILTGYLILNSINLFENSTTIAHNMTPTTLTYYGIMFNIFDNSNLTISNVSSYISATGNSVINATNLLHASLNMWSNTKATFRLSSISSIECYEQPVIFLLQSTTCEDLYCEGTSDGYPYNNATIYKDATSSISWSWLTDGAQIINI